MEKKKIIEFEILKALLIVLVVIGHAIPDETPLHHIIYWFHMPTFFMISGFFSSKPKDMKATITKKATRLILPYLSWSVLLYILFIPENPIKNIARVLFGGVNNTTIYSYPFWFVNALFISSIVFSYMLSIGNRYVKCLLLGAFFALYCFVHTDVFPLPFSVPWAMDVAIGVLPYILIGYYFKDYKYKIIHWVFCVAPILFMVWQAHSGYIYSMNMKAMNYNNFLLDLLVPCSFAFLCLLLSYAIAKIKYAGALMAKVGDASMTIMFTHAAILYSLGNIPICFKILIAILGGAFIQYTIESNKYCSLVFIGKSKK